MRPRGTTRTSLFDRKLIADSYIRFERELSSPNEVFSSGGDAFPLYGPVLDEMDRMGPEEWERRVRRAHGRMLGRQREVGIHSGDKTHPMDYVPRLIPAADFGVLERGLTQRMLAINEWLRRLERGEQELVPREVIESSALYDASIPNRFGDVPNRQMRFDIVAVDGGAGRSGGWNYLVIEDNAKMPVDIEPMSLIRERAVEVVPGAMTRVAARIWRDTFRRFLCTSAPTGNWRVATSSFIGTSSERTALSPTIAPRDSP